MDAGELVVLPGLVDTHVHVSEPGRTEREAFSTTTQFARPSLGNHQSLHVARGDSLDQPQTGRRKG